MDLHFKQPFTCLIAGPTKAGKTTFIRQLIKNIDRMVFPTPEKIWWCYTEYQDAYDDLKDRVIFVKGSPDLSLIRENMPTPQLIILDDLMQEMENDSNLIELFTKGCHHWNISIVHIVQNAFFKGLR